jgi:glyoxylase-like metal-dependent hydrolase (beta-lactamase superfamily II)
LKGSSTAVYSRVGGSVIIRQLTLGVAGTNCYVVGCESTREGVVIDPSDDGARILAMVEQESLAIRYVLNTHAHFDHILANRVVMEATGAPLALHPQDLPLLHAGGGAELFGIEAESSPDPTIHLAEGMEVRFGRHAFHVLFTPGHSPGHVSFYDREEGVVFDGDVLFAAGIGRTDLPGGDYETLMESIHSKLLVLPDATRVYPGHGPTTTLGAERVNNPWLA